MSSPEQGAALVREPPEGFLRSCRYFGPGFILSAAVVGSGELIATTALGARAGFTLLWVILASCLLKVAVQIEYGRQAVLHGRPSLESWNTLPGPRLAGVHWSVHAGLLFLLSTFLGAAGIMGGAAQILLLALPGVPLGLCALILAATLSLLVFHGRYRPVELIAGFLNLAFVSMVLYSNAVLAGTPYSFGLSEIASGFALRLPPEGLALAMAVFGITGVGAGEIVMYPSWCLEKGYGAWTGPNDGSPGWARRARGWIQVMQRDASLSMAAYTVATCGFYFLGAAVLSRQPALSDGNLLVVQLSQIFTEVLGEGSRAVFMVCAFTVLFSSLFSNTAGLSRLWVDLFGIYRLIEPSRHGQRLKTLAVAAWLLPATWASVYLVFPRPLFLVVLMGLSNAVFLLVVAYQAVVFRYHRRGDCPEPSRLYDAGLWLSILAIGLVAWQAFVSLLRGR